MKMKKVKTVAACILVLIALIAAGCSQNPPEKAESKPPPAAAATAPPPAGPVLSENPDKETFAQYFKELYLAKLPEGKTLPFVDRTTTFTTKDTFCIGGTIIKDVQLTVKYYDTAAKKLVEAGGAPPSTLKPGGFVGSSSMPVPAGKWELKVYVGDKLVAVLPFEVK